MYASSMSAVERCAFGRGRPEGLWYLSRHPNMYVLSRIFGVPFVLLSPLGPYWNLRARGTAFPSVAGRRFQSPDHWAWDAKCAEQIRSLNSWGAEGNSGGGRRMSGL